MCSAQEVLSPSAGHSVPARTNDFTRWKVAEKKLGSLKALAPLKQQQTEVTEKQDG